MMSAAGDCGSSGRLPIPAESAEALAVAMLSGCPGAVRGLSGGCSCSARAGLELVAPPVGGKSRPASWRPGRFPVACYKGFRLGYSRRTTGVSPSSSSAAQSTLPAALRHEAWPLSAWLCADHVGSGTQGLDWTIPSLFFRGSLSVAATSAQDLGTPARPPCRLTGGAFSEWSGSEDHPEI